MTIARGSLSRPPLASSFMQEALQCCSVYAPFMCEILTLSSERVRSRRPSGLKKAASIGRLWLISAIFGTPVAESAFQSCAEVPARVKMRLSSGLKTALLLRGYLPEWRRPR
jgi:hypothetical protein